MATTETIGGKCPKCGYNKMFMRYGTSGWFKYDACPKCLFAYGQANESDDYTPIQVWDVLLKHLEPVLMDEGLPITIEGLLKFTERTGRDDEYEYDSVFIYNAEGERI